MDLQVCTKERLWRWDFDVGMWKHPATKFTGIVTNLCGTLATYECPYCAFKDIEEVLETEPESYQ